MAQHRQDRKMETLTFLLTSSFYPPFHIGGDAVHVRYLAEELAKLGHEVHVLHSLDAYRVKRNMPRVELEHDGIRRHAIETALSLSAYEAYMFGTVPKVARRFRALIKDVRPNVVHHHNISLLGYDLLLKRGGYLNLYTAHDYWLICPQNRLLKRNMQVCETASCIACSLYDKRPPQFWRYFNRFRRAIDDIDILIAPSDYAKKRITGKFPIRAITIPNFAPSPPSRIESSGFSNFLMYAGGLEKHKGILRLLGAWKELPKDLKLVLVGEGKLRQEVNALISRNGLESSVFPLGWVDDYRMYSLLSDSDGLVIPSIWPENSPLISLESLSVGTPVVGSSLGGLQEIVSKLDSRLVFSWECYGNLVRAITFLHQNLGDLKKRANETYLQHFSAEVYLSSYSKLLSTSCAA